MVVATAERAGSSDRQAFDLFAQRVPATVLRCHGRPEELRLACAGCATRLSIASGTLLEGPVRLSFHLSGDHFLSIRLRALRAFDGLMSQGRIPVLPVPFTPNSRKMMMVLATIDGLARGWSQREIATALFGAEAVAADWAGRSDFLKSRVRRLIASARNLGGDAYLGLLQR